MATNELKLTDEVLLTVNQAAKLIHTDPARVRSYIHAGLLKALKLGELKIRREEIDAFLKRSEGLDLSDPSNVRKLKHETI